MTNFAADLHIHSRFSRATSKGLTLGNLAAWAEAKGISVLGTGDCTHPGWLSEIEKELQDDGSGLLKLRDANSLSGQLPDLGLSFAGSARFLLQGEISSIYKRGGKVRKVHNLVFLPTLEAAKKLNAKLAQVGNLVSDGRPILGLDSRNLLEMVLETHPEAFLVPAHIWTPWFSLFGSMSGFDSVEACYGDLTSEIFAMETGLSSDPGMNWTLSQLDRYRMISNSDAHSGEKLGREANLFRGEPSFSGLRQALRAHQTGEAGDCEFLGTVEFFPEEGKYHLDGHRKCNWSMEPAETLAHKGLCPVCGKPATLGVLHRVLALADRAEPVKPAGQPGYDSLIPLREVLSEVLDCGAGTKTVTAEYARLLGLLGPELSILREVPVPDIRRASPLLAEAVERMRAGKVLRKSGFDGEFGVITVFTPEERAELKSGLHLLPGPARRGRKPGARQTPTEPAADTDPEPAAEGPGGLNPAQEAAAAARLDEFDPGGPVLVLAGPGTGKTHTLLARVERLLASGVAPETLAVVTFTRRAAEELRERLSHTAEARAAEARATEAHTAAKPAAAPAALPVIDTLHALALALWTARRGKPPVLLSEDAARKLFVESLPADLGDGLQKKEREALYRLHSLSRETLQPLAGPRAALAEAAQAEAASFKAARNLADFTDLVEFLLAEVRQPGFAPPFAHLLVDEVQDLSALQLEAVMGLAGPAGPRGGKGFFAIGDPNQSIYAFRGAVGGEGGDVRQRLTERWPQLAVLALAENYRSGQGILDAAAALLPEPPRIQARPRAEWRVELVQAPDAGHEAQAIASRIHRLIGGTSLTLHDADGPQLAPGDVAVLLRTRALIAPLKAALEKTGLPCSAPEAEVFWEEPRVAAILRVAERLFGLPAPTGPEEIPLESPEGAALESPEGTALESPEGAEGAEGAEGTSEGTDLPEFLLLQGPHVLPAALRETPPFDRFFWEGPAFRDLCHEFDLHGGWVGLLDWVRLETGLGVIRQAAQKVRLLTLHAAKGLEFEAVFLPALEDGILPWSGFGGAAELPPEALAEERRLLYVGMTRAKRFLCLSFATERTFYGRSLAQKPSRFLADLPQGLVRRTLLAERVQTRQTQLQLF